MASGRALCGDTDGSSEEESVDGGEAGRDPGKRWPELPGKVEISREMFEERLRHRALHSWEEFVEAAGIDAPSPPRGDGGSVVRMDPMQVFSWVATVMIEVCIWGLVAWSSQINVGAGILCTVCYGSLLYAIAAFAVAPRISGMIWPNVPCAVAAAGGLIGHSVLSSDSRSVSPSEGAGVMLMASIFPHNVATCCLLCGVRRDPDRAPLASNLFLGIWATLLDIFVVVEKDDDFWRWWHFGGWSLLFVGLVFIGTGFALLKSRSSWGSQELVSWTLNLGVLGFAVAGTSLLDIPAPPSWTNWLLYGTLVAAMGVASYLSERSFPLLITGIGVAIIIIRMCVEVGVQSGSAIMGFASFGIAGLLIISVMQLVGRSLKS